ncbi:scoloptoxin SSD14-like isoform X1 [Asterias rubens]|uniref:scoloptoxin SSD14-like isoform X1 n=1 Tax=Asterias rubens TaxID=7604 RepID=UPI001455313B|nr:scoloptoxin SSD14-like isoform X1 [Asterias rubens]
MNEFKYEALLNGGESTEEFELEEYVSDKASLIDTQKSVRKEKVPLNTQQSIHAETIFGFDGLKVIILSAVVVSLAITAAMVITILIGEPQVPPHGAVATGNSVCSAAGVSILQRGGSAVDAAIAAMLCIGVVNPQSSGLGGGGFMLVLDAQSAAYTGIDFRGTAPEGSQPTMFVDKPGASLVGGLAVTVPGELHGMKRAWEKFGKIRWKELFEPAIDAARHGFKVTGSLEQSIMKTDMSSPAARNLRKAFMPLGNPLTAGDTMYRRRYADLLERIASNGVKELYTGKTAREIVDMINEFEGNMTMADLRGYKTRDMAPITTTYRDYNLVTLPQPSGGPMLLTLMNILELYNVTQADQNTALYYHRFIEALKFVKAQEVGLGDSSSVNYTQNMISKSNAELLYAHITDNMTHSPYYYFSYAESILKTQGTSHISVIDKDNNMVSVTSTINTAFGSLLMTPSEVILNNQMDDFNWLGKELTSNKSKANFIASGKRPQSHMAPVMGRNASTACARRFATGGEGGGHITSGIAQIVMELLAFKSTLYNATMKSKRVYTPLIPNEVEVEDEFPRSIRQNLQALGHEIVDMDSEDAARVNTIMKENDIMYAQSDLRRSGAQSVQY